MVKIVTDRVISGIQSVTNQSNIKITISFKFDYFFQESSDAPAAAEVVAEKPDEPKDKEMDEGEKPAEASEPEKATSVEDTKASDAMETDPPAPDPVPDQEKATES